MDFQQWLKQWFSHHPAKDPVSQDRAAYTAEVMQRVKELEAPAQAPAPVWSWWRPTLALAAAAGIVLLVVSKIEQTPQIAEEISSQPETIQVVSIPEVRSPQAAEPAPLPPAMVLAEDADQDTAWLEETLLLLEALDEDLPMDSSDGWSDEQWLDEIELLDDDLFSS